MMRINWLLLPLMLLACNTYRSYGPGYVVTDIKHVGMTDNEMFAKTGLRFFCDDLGSCRVMEVTLLHAGHTIKAVCHEFDQQNHCGDIQVGRSFEFTQDQSYLSLETPKMRLTVEEEHDNSR